MKVHTNLRAGQFFGGSYYETCDNIEENLSPDGNFMEINAICTQMNGARNFTSANVPMNYQGDVSNCDGDLVLGSCW